MFSVPEVGKLGDGIQIEKLRAEKDSGSRQSELRVPSAATRVPFAFSGVRPLQRQAHIMPQPERLSEAEAPKP